MGNYQFDNLTAFCAGENNGKVTLSHTIRISCKEQVEKILLCNVDSNITSYECITGQATISGKNNVKLVFCDNDNNIFSSSSSADFSDIITHSDIMPTSKLSFEVVVVDYKTDIVGNIVTVQLLVEVNATVYTQHTLPHLVGGEELFVRYHDVELLDMVDSAMLTSDLSTQLTATSNITRVIMADSKITVNDYTLADRVLTVSGEVVVGLLYMSDDNMVYDMLTSPYRTEIACNVVNGQLLVKGSVRNTRIKLDIIEEEFNNVFTADIIATFDLLSMSQSVVSVVADCYSKDCNTVLERSNIKTTLACGSVSSSRTIEQVVSDIADADKCVAFTNANAVVTSCVSRDGGVVVEGIVSGTALFGGEEGFASTYIELPFVETVDIDYVSPLCVAKASAHVTSSWYKGNGNSLTVNASLVIDIFSSRTENFTVITNVEGTVLDKSTVSAIEVCLAKKGDTLWDIAKSLHMSEDDILNINADIVSPLEDDTKLVIYNRL